MDKKNKKKTVIKRKSDDTVESEKKKMVNRAKVEELNKDKIEVANQVVEVPVEDGQQIVHTGQLVEGNFEQPVFVNMKGEPVQLGPNTVILYEQSGNPSNFAFGGMWTMDSSGRIVMAETIYDVKGEPEEETGAFVQNATEVSSQQVDEQGNTFQQYELSNTPQVETQQEYEVAIIDNSPGENNTRSAPEPQVITTEEQLVATGTGAVRWLNQKYDFVVRKLQLNYDAGVKLLHSPSGCIQCVYLTTPSMQLAFNAVPQFLCIETGIEFNSAIPTVGATSSSSVKHNVTLFLAEDGNGKSVIVSAGISTLIGDDLTWLLDTFKSCNPAWRQVRCVVCDPTKCQQVVFKKEVKTKEPQQRNSFSKRTGQFQLSDRWRGKKQDEQPELDPDGRPRLKVALLCGPPGVGKTTLAHLLARLAGYRPVELNASDERSTEAFSTALKSATLMQSVLDADKRPNCLILDEIDGAPLATVELLVKWCTATTEGGKKKGKAQPLRRPVIAICNDQYATSLRPLRPVSLVLQVGGVSLHRLTSRLSRVAECEGLHAPPHVLAALAARAQGDVRAAIQVLSFIRAKAIAQLRMEDVENASIGTKDCSKSLMQALTALFTVNDKDPNAVLKTVQAAGEYDRLINIHRNAKSCGNKKQN